MTLPLMRLTSSFLGLAASALAAPASAQAAGLQDIAVARDGDVLRIMVYTDSQPTGAAARATGTSLVLELDGVSLPPSAFSPPAGSIIETVTVAPSGTDRSRLSLAGPIAGEATATVYRGAVLIEARLSPVRNEAPAKMAGAPPQKLAEGYRTTGETASGAKVARSAKLNESAAEPVQKAAPRSASAAPEKPAPVTSASLQTASGTGMSCEAAKAALEKDAWDVAALGDHALCLADAGKMAEAKNRLDQLAAFDPDDPRVKLGRTKVAAARPAKAPEMKDATRSGSGIEVQGPKTVAVKAPVSPVAPTKPETPKEVHTAQHEAHAAAEKH